METKIAIQGIQGSFHHQVAQNYFPNLKVLEECMSFPAVVQQVLQEENTIGIMALENSIAGSILPNYALIDQSDLQIIGEYYLDIHMNLMVLPGQKIEDIQEVHSHPIALLQCAVFFKQYPHIKLVESEDTAETAKRIQQQQLQGIGAVAAPIAAKLYDLEIIAAGIHTVKSNKTRFVLVQNKISNLDTNSISKASLKFELEDSSGALAFVLQKMHQYHLNLTKIQSLPIIETPFQYAFFVDVEIENYSDYLKAKEDLKTVTKNFKVLGEYKKGMQ